MFSHGWPLSADAWDAQMLFLGERGYRVIAHDSTRPWPIRSAMERQRDGHLADDLATLIQGLDLRDVTLVGHSTGGGEVARYLGRHGSQRVAKAVLIGAVPPIMLKTKDNPGGLPMEVFDQIRSDVFNDRSQFFKDLTTPFFGYNRPGAKPHRGP
jgi:non-heme chloroperoxidase